MSAETLADLMVWLESRKGKPQPPPARYGNVRGEACGRAKLTEVGVIQIRERYSAGASLRQLATQYGVHPGTIGAIVRGHSWAHVGGPRTERSKL